jgi:3-oxoacyl-[acyl-carrier protein] reductase
VEIVSDLMKDCNVLITAAAGAGIGFATALRCVEEGAQVVLSDAHEGRLERAQENLKQRTGYLAPTVIANVTDQQAVEEMWRFAVESLGTVDILINNAGIAIERSIADLTDDEWHLVMDVTLTGTFRCVREALRYMVPRGSGTVVNISSVLGWRAQPNQAPYAAAKAGVMALTRTAAMEAAPAGVRVNCVVPSLALHPHLVKSTSQNVLDELVSREAFGRAADPAEVADVIVFLASDQSRYMTGECISVSSQHP